MFVADFSQKCYKRTLRRQRATTEIKTVSFVTINEQRCPNLKRQNRESPTQSTGVTNPQD